MEEKSKMITQKLKVGLNKLNIEINTYKKYAFFTAIILGILAHFTLYSQLITTTDGFHFGTRYYAGAWEISLGRWFIVILNILRYGLVSPAHITFFSIFILAITSILIVDIFEIKNKVTAIITSACIVLAPFVYQTLLYEFTADAYFIALLLSVLTVFFYKRKNKILSIISIVLLMAIYQSYINVVMFLGLSLIILNLIQDKQTIDEAIKDFFIYYIVCFIGILLYYIVTLVILKITGIQLSDYSGASTNGILNIIQNLPKGIFQSYYRTYSYFFNDLIINNSVYKREILYAIMYIFLLINVLLQKDKTKVLTILCFIIISPIMIAFSEVLIVNRNINILMSASLICPILLCAKFIEIQDTHKMLKYGQIIVICIILYTYAIMGEATYTTLQQNYEQVYTKLIRVVDKIESHEEFKEGMKVAFVGEFEYFNKLDVYELGNGDFTFLGVFRSVQNASLEGILKERFGANFIVYDIRAESEENYAQLNQELSKMEAFPKEECIKVIDDIMLVKLN